jgi:hypothetical protein
VHTIQGDDKMALEVQKECGRTMLGIVEGVPVVGHAVAIGYAVTGNDEDAVDLAQVVEAVDHDLLLPQLPQLRAQKLKWHQSQSQSHQ